MWGPVRGAGFSRGVVAVCLGLVLSCSSLAPQQALGAGQRPGRPGRERLWRRELRRVEVFAHRPRHGSLSSERQLLHTAGQPLTSLWGGSPLEPAQHRLSGKPGGARILLLLAGELTSRTVSNLPAGLRRAGSVPVNPNLGFFAQDAWKARPTLALQFGLRYDIEKLPEPIHTDYNNVAPRFGVAWSPGDQKTVVRAGYGLFYDRVPLRATSNA